MHGLIARCWMFWLVFILILANCGGNSDKLAADGDLSGGDQDVETISASLAEKLGLTQYVGKIDPIEYSHDGQEATYRFDSAQGPICMRGAEYKVSVRDTGSPDLVVFLQGGGACWSEFCLAITAAPEGIPLVDLLNEDLSSNPVADWSIVYLPYCDGSFFVGEAQHDDNINDLGTRYHKGLANLTAALEVTKFRFPNPQRILLAGSSGGGYGLLLAGPLLRHYYPDVELIMMADSGIGLARDGEPDYLQTALNEFNVQNFFPEDCEDCQDNGHITGLLSYFLDYDPDVRVGMYSSWYDSILAKVFLHIPGEQFAKGLQEQTDRIHAAFPDRFRRFITDGIQHTSLLGTPNSIIGSDLTAIELPEGGLEDLMSGVKIGGMDETILDGQSMSEWLTALIDNDTAQWKDLLEEKGSPPELE